MSAGSTHAANRAIVGAVLRALLALSAPLLLAGCPPQAACPLGRTRAVPASLLAVEGKEVLVTMTFPAPTRCALPEGTLMASGSLRMSGRAPQPLTVRSLEHDERAGEVTVTFAVTPLAPGVGDLEAFVDPQLGIGQLPVLVARDGLNLPFVDVTAPCPEPQRTTSGVVVCPEPRGDAGLTLWVEGQQVGALPDALEPQVVGELLWTHRFADAGFVVERTRVHGDGGLEVTHQTWVGGFRPATPRSADEGRLMRLGFVATALDDGGLELVNAHQASNADALLAEPDVAWAWVTDRWCAADGGCLPRTSGAKVAGVEPTVWWQLVSSQLVVFRRPIGDAGSIASVPLAAGRPVTLRASVQGARRPRLTEGQSVYFLEWERDAGTVSLTHFPDWRVGEENAETVSFGLDGGVVRFVRLR